MGRMVVSRRNQGWISLANNSLNFSFLGDDAEYKVRVNVESIIGGTVGRRGGAGGRHGEEIAMVPGDGGGGDKGDTRLSRCKSLLRRDLLVSRSAPWPAPRGACV